MNRKPINASLVVYSCLAFTTLLLLLCFGQFFLEILLNGFKGLSIGWFTQIPSDAGRSGGISSILVSTLLIVSVCIVCAIPLGLFLAIFLVENKNAFPKTHRYLSITLDILAAVPSIVYGLFGYAFFVDTLGMGFSILAGGLTLCCMVLPFMARLFEQALANEAGRLRLPAVATGMLIKDTYLKVLIPAAAKGLTAAIILSVARALSETAALIYTAGYVDRMPQSIMDSGRSLSIHILDLAMNVPGGNDNSYTSALSLMIILLLINIFIFKVFKSDVNKPEVRI